MTPAFSAPLSHRFKPKFFSLVIVVTLLIAASMVRLSTPFGIGTSPDSATYVGVANNLLQGKGLTVPFGTAPGQPLTNYPPFYPVALAFSGSFNPDISQSARWLQVFLFSANTLIWFVFLRNLLDKSSWLAGLTLLPLVFAPGLLRLHVMAWSEGLFLWVGFGGMLVTLAAIRQASTVKFLIAGGLLALAVLTRYAGITLLAAALIGVMILSKNRLRQRVIQSIGLGLPGITALVLWFVFTSSFGGDLGNRILSVHFPPVERLLQGVNTVSIWLSIPITAPSWIKILSILLVGIFGFVMTVRSGKVEPNNANAQLSARLLLVFSLLYGLFLLVTLTFADANTPLDERILAPLLVSGYLGLVYAIRRSLRLFPRPLPAIIAFMTLSLGLWGLGNNALQDYRQVAQAHANGIGFNSPVWQNSASIKALATLPANQAIVSNSPEMVYLLTSRAAAPLPRRRALTSGKPNPNFESEILQLKDQLSQQKVVVMYFKNISSQNTLDITALQAWLEPQTVIEQTDGWLMAGKQP